MASTNKTANLELSQFEGSDKPDWLTDYNGDMLKIDTNYGAVAAEAEAATTASQAAAASAAQAALDAASALSGIAGAIEAASAATAAAEQATSVSTSALSTANSALSTASAAAGDATTAMSTAQNAKNTAESAQAAAAQAATDAAASAASAAASATAAEAAASLAQPALQSIVFDDDNSVTPTSGETWGSLLERLLAKIDVTKIRPTSCIVTRRDSGSAFFVYKLCNSPIAGATYKNLNFYRVQMERASGSIYPTITMISFVSGSAYHGYTQAAPSSLGGTVSTDLTNNTQTDNAVGIFY